MKIKKFQAPNIQEAMRLVKDSLGSDAVILHTRNIRRKGIWGWLGLDQVEVTAALDVNIQEPVLPKPLPKKVSSPVSPSGAVAASSQVKADDRIDKLESKLSSIEGALQKLVERTKPEDNYWGWQQERIDIYKRLIENQVLEGVAHQIVSGLPEEFETAVSSDRINMVKSVISSFIQINPPPSNSNGGVKIVPLIGPTGVGKTTTLAKIAAQYALNDLGRVALITADTYRIAAADQLAKYAEILGLPLSVVYTPDEMIDSLASYQDYNFVFVDTAGRSPHHETHMQELDEIIKLLGMSKVLLLVSCSTNFTDMLDIVDRFSLCPIEGLVFTKLDEVEKYGNMLNLIQHVNLPVMYLTTGQNVPEDIELATTEKIVDLVWGESETVDSVEKPEKNSTDEPVEQINDLSEEPKPE